MAVASPTIPRPAASSPPFPHTAYVCTLCPSASKCIKALETKQGPARPYARIAVPLLHRLPIRTAPAPQPTAAHRTPSCPHLDCACPTFRPVSVCLPCLSCRPIKLRPAAASTFACTKRVGFWCQLLPVSFVSSFCAPLPGAFSVVPARFASSGTTSCMHARSRPRAHLARNHTVPRRKCPPCRPHSFDI